MYDVGLEFTSKSPSYPLFLKGLPSLLWVQWTFFLMVIKQMWRWWRIGCLKSCFRVCISTFVINQEHNYIWSKEKKSFTVAGQDETVPIHMAANLPVESNHYCQLNHFRLTWRQNRELSTPLPVRKKIFFPHFIGTTHIKMSHIDMPRECFMLYAVTAVWAFDK